MQNSIPTGIAIKTLHVSSPAFKQYEYIPSKYTCDGANEGPILKITSLPKRTKCIAVIVDDPDGPIGTWVHWIAWNIPPNDSIVEKKNRGIYGLNDFGMHSYCGPCPPNGMHHYHFKVYALDKLLNLPYNATKTTLEKAMSTHIIASGELIGLYKRKNEK